jgi:hypothetical protein
MPAINHIRAARYRALAQVEKDQARAALLGRIAEEADHGVLCTVRHLRLVHDTVAQTVAFLEADSDTALVNFC